MSTPVVPLPRGHKSWHEFYQRMVNTAASSGVELKDDFELNWENIEVIAGFRMTVQELPPGLTVGHVKILAFDEIQRSMPTNRRQLFDESHGFAPPGDGSPIRWLDNLIREKNLSTFA